MEAQRLTYLLDRHYKGTCTPDEEQELDIWYRSLNMNDQQFENLVGSAGGEEQLAGDMYAEFKAYTDTKVRRLNPYRWIGRVAAVLIGFGLLIGGYYILEKRDLSNNLTAAIAPAKANQNKFITLADGSKVVLRSGSRLNFPSSFSGKTREVELIGEAYFDIHHDSAKPFIIHTGKIKTTVLGTAFDIAAYPSQKVVVTVTRGRVRVDDDQKISVILTPNEQVVCDSKTEQTQKNKVEANRSLAWAGSDMVFDGVAFKTIATLLSRRYQVSVDFKNPALEQCPITASFSGTETLKDILEILCTARGTSYKFDGTQKVTIDGAGCN